MKHTILVIEDNERNLYLTTFILEKRGHRIIQAHNGEVGLALAQEETPDLILLDIQLPDKDGYTVAKELRDISKLENVPIVAVTSYAMVGDREKILAAGCQGYIEKPINPKTFVDDVENFL